MIIQGEHVQHQVCNGCYGGESLVSSIEASNTHILKIREETIEGVNKRMAESIDGLPEIRGYIEELNRIAVEEITVICGLQRAVCTRSGPGFIRGCGVESVTSN